MSTSLPYKILALLLVHSFVLTSLAAPEKHERAVQYFKRGG